MISPACRLHLGQHRLQPFLELAAILRAGDQRAHVERQQRLVLDALGHVAVDDPEREALGDRGLADAGLADQHGIVLRAPAQHLHRAADFLVAADDRVDLALARRLGQVARVFLERVIALLGGGAVGGAALAHVVDRRVQPLRRDAGRLERVVRGGFRHRERGQEPLDRHEAVLGLRRDLLRLGEDLAGLGVHVELALPALDARQLGKLGLDIGPRHHRIAAGRLDQVGRQTLVVVEQRLEQVLRQEPLVVLAHGDGLRRLDKSPRPF
jgi:hypothetical protein